MVMPSQRINNLELYYEVVGEGRPLVFVHGFSGNLTGWAFQIPAFAPHYQTVCLDLRGHGRSEHPTSPEAYSIDLFAADLHGLLRFLDVETCYLVGHSMGGMVALEFAFRHQEMLRALVLMDTSSGEIDRHLGVVLPRDKLEELARNQGMEAVFEFNLAHNPQLQQLLADPELKHLYKEQFLLNSPHGYIYSGRAVEGWVPVTGRLSQIKMPTLILVGENDLPFLRPSQVLHQGIAGSELVVIPGAGHTSMAEAPEAVNQAIMDFLQRVDGSR